MLRAINRFGLSRDISLPIKRIIRQNSGFGCVVCGLGIYEYEHVDPPFIDAESHNPTCITILCPSCHGKVTRGMWSKEKIMQHMLNPKALQQGFANEQFDLSSNEDPIVQIGGMTFNNVNIPIAINDIALIKIKPPETPHSPYLLSGIFYDSNNVKTLTIEDNEWRAFSRNWDVEVTGPVIRIREKERRIALAIRVNPPNGIVIEELNMLYRGIYIEANNNEIRIGSNIFAGGNMQNGNIGIYVAVDPTSLNDRPYNIEY